MDNSRLFTSTPNIQAVGIPWYTLEDYERIKQVMEDAHLLPQVYSLWRIKAEQIERQARREGKRAIGAPLRPDEFVAWCRERGLNVNAKARMEWAAWFAAQEHGDLH